MTQHDGRSVAGDLDDVLGRVGPRRGEVRRDHLVDGVAFAIEQFGKLRLPGLPLRADAQDRFGDAAGIGAGQAHDSQSAATGRRGNRDYGVVQDQGRRAERAFGPRPPPGTVAIATATAAVTIAAAAAGRGGARSRGGSGRLAMPAG